MNLQLWCRTNADERIQAAVLESTKRMWHIRGATGIPLMVRIPNRWRGLFVFLYFFSAAASASQSPPAEKTLDSSAATTVARRLASLETLEIPQIRYFAGENPMASSTNYDDSSWTPIQIDQQWIENSVWLRIHLIVPEQIHGYVIRDGRLSFSLGLRGANIARVYLNGVALNAGQEREPILLTEHAIPGESLLVAIYVTAEDREKQIREAKFLLEAFNRPDPSLLGQEFLVSETMIKGLAPNDTEHAAVLAAAVNTVDWAALERSDQVVFDQSLIKAKLALEPLRQWMQQYSIRAAGNAHIDMAWLWPWTETVDVVHRTFASALQLMREFPTLTYTHSSAQAYEWMEEKYPPLFEEIRRRVREGRWELIGGMWVEPDLNMPDGESQVRQLLLGKQYFKKKFGVDIRTGWNPDSFGYNWQLPQIYKKSGIDFFVTQKMTWNDTTEFPYKLFWWQSPDGSRVLTYFPHGYNNVLGAVKMANDLSVYANTTKYPEMLYLFGVGDHGGGPTRTMLQTAEHWSRDGIYPRLAMGTVQPFFDQLAKQASTMNLPVWNNELYLEFHRGVYTSQAETKKGNRRSEELLLTTEKLSTFATLLGKKYPQDDLRLAWKKVLFNQFHDIAAGSGIPAVYLDASRDYAEVRRIGEQNLHAATNEILSHVDTRGTGVAIAVFNPLSWKRTDLVTAEIQLAESANNIEVLDAAGKRSLAERLSNSDGTKLTVRFVANDVPPLGYKIFRLLPVSTRQEEESSLRAGPDFIENEFYRVKIDVKTGCITNLWDKIAKWEALEKGSCGNQLQAFSDNPSEYDAWNIDSDFEKQQWNLDVADEVKLVENTPLRVVMRVQKHFQNSTFVQDLTLVPGVARIDVVTKADWHEKHILLKVAFPVAAHSDTATYEIPYGSISRPTTRSTPEERAKFEVPALRWADLSDDSHGLSLLNDAKYGYDCKNNVLRLTLLRSPSSPDPHADEGEHEFTYSLFPHAAKAENTNTVHNGYELNTRLVAVQTASHPGELPAEYSFVRIAPENLIVTAIKQSEDAKDMIIRFYELAGRKTSARITTPAGATGVVETNLMEEESAKAKFDGSTVTLDVNPNEIKTLRVKLP